MKQIYYMYITLKVYQYLMAAMVAPAVRLTCGRLCVRIPAATKSFKQVVTADLLNAQQQV